jgi:MFS family permease
MSESPSPSDAPPPPPRGFWARVGGWALPRDARGEGYQDLTRGHAPEVGFCLLFVFASSWGQTFLLAVFQPYWVRELGITAGTMGTLYAAATLGSGLLLPWAGRWLDRAAPPFTGTVTLLGLSFFAAGMAFVTHPAVLLLMLFGLRFLGQGVSSSIGLTNAGRWFTHNRGKALTLAALGFPLGEALLPISLTLLLAFAGWRHTWLLLAAVSLVVFLPLARWLGARHRHDRTEPPSPRVAHHGTGSLWRDWRFLSLLVMMAPLPFVSTGVIFFQGFIAESHGWTDTVIPTAFIVFALVRAVWSLSAGAWVDRLGAIRLIPLPPLLFGLGLLFLFHSSPFSAHLFFAFLGLSFGCAGAISTGTWSDVFGTDRLGFIRGISSSAAVFVTALAPLVFGLAIDHGLTLEGMILGNVILLLGLAFPASLLLRRLLRSGSSPSAPRFPA